MAQKWGNNSASVLAAGISDTDTSVTVYPSHGSRFPVVAAPDYAFATLEDASGNVEIVKIVAHVGTGNAFTVERAQQGTEARAWVAGDLFEMRLTASELARLEAEVDALEASRVRKAGDTYLGFHDLTAATGVLLPAATKVGNVTDLELARLEGLRSNAQGQIDGVMAAIPVAVDAAAAELWDALTTKADIAGESYSGGHDFSGATLAVATPALDANDARPASTAWVQALRLSGTDSPPPDASSDGITRYLSSHNGIRTWAPVAVPANDLALMSAGVI